MSPGARSKLTKRRRSSSTRFVSICRMARRRKNFGQPAISERSVTTHGKGASNSYFARQVWTINAKSRPIGAVIATRDRAPILDRMLRSLDEQTRQPMEVVVIDGSSDSATQAVCKQVPLQSRLIYRKAERTGAAIQRNQGIPLASAPFILFCDDDIVFEPECIPRLWRALQDDPALG